MVWWKRRRRRWGASRGRWGGAGRCCRVGTSPRPRRSSLPSRHNCLQGATVGATGEMSTGGGSAAAEAGTLLKQSCWDERKERRKVDEGGNEDDSEEGEDGGGENQANAFLRLLLVLLGKS